jgi:uncharacterized protein YjbI with pentapeptide repeats
MCIGHESGPKSATSFVKAVRCKVRAGDWDFEGWTFPVAARFTGTTSGRVNFRKAHFLSTASFKHVRFMEDADFWSACFDDVATFDDAAFDGIPTFWGIRFKHRVEMRNISFRDESHFTACRFMQGVDFFNSSFAKRAHFAYVSFERLSGFELAEVSKCEFVDITDAGPREGEQLPPTIRSG